MVLALRMLTQSRATDDIRCCDARVHPQRHDRIIDPVRFVGEVATDLGQVKELFGFSQPPRRTAWSHGRVRPTTDYPDAATG
nr:hypothetical protein GCM10017611_52120 [Rhodococcus wratislaviensis]